MVEKQLYDIEVFKNFFCVGIKNLETKEIIFYEISEEINQLKEIYTWFINYRGFLISFNGLHYDNVVVKHLMKNYNKYKTWDWNDVTLDLKRFSDKIIYGDYDDEIKQAKYTRKAWIDIDLFMYWSKMIRISKKISLKSLGIQLGYHTVQELPYKHDTVLRKEDLPKLRYYNYTHDLGILELLTEKMKGQIVQRADAIRKFGFGNECFSWDGVKLGLNILLKEYCVENNTTLAEIKDLRTPFPQEGIKIKELILPQIKFKETEQKFWNTRDKKGNTIINCNSFYTLFEHIKTRTVYSTKDLSYSVVFNGVKYDIKSGGLHSWHENDVVEPDPNKFLYKDVDVGSYYPTLGSEYGFVPQHLIGMDRVIKRIKVLRLQYKAEKNMKDAELYKLALNGGYYGNLNSEYTAMYDPKALLSVTINGQLFLLMLAEWLEEQGISIDMCNTDGITCIIPKEKEDLFKEIYNKWEKVTRMELEEVEYTKVIRKNINNYMAISKDNKIKRKGLFKLQYNEKGDDEIPLGDSIDEVVISKALTAYYDKGIEPKEFISNPAKYDLHIYDFCKSNKIDKGFTVYWNGEVQQNLNRYYFSKQGAYLFKRKNNQGTFQHVNVGQSVILFNNYEDKEWSEYNIDYNYYVIATQKIIDELNNLNQLTLF